MFGSSDVVLAVASDPVIGAGQHIVDLIDVDLDCLQLHLERKAVRLDAFGGDAREAFYGVIDHDLARRQIDPAA